MEKSSYARINGFQDNIAHGRENRVALPRRRALPICMRGRPGALLLAAAWVSGQAARRLHAGRYPPRIPHRQELRAPLHGSLRAPDLDHGFLARSRRTWLRRRWSNRRGWCRSGRADPLVRAGPPGPAFRLQDQSRGKPARGPAADGGVRPTAASRNRWATRAASNCSTQRSPASRQRRPAISGFVKVQNARGQSFGALRLYQRAVRQHLGDGRGARRHHRLARRHGLQQYDAEAFLDAGQAENAGTVVLSS